MFKRMIKGIILVGLSLIVLSACNDKDKDKDKDKDQAANEKGDVVATVNGEEISKSEYDTLLEDMKASYSQQGIDVETLDEEMKKQMETQVLDQLINTELLTQLATKDGITVEENSVNEQLEGIKAQFEDDKKYKEALEKNKLTEDTLKEKIQTEVLITQFLEKNVGEVKVTDEEINKAYDEYKAAMVAEKQEVQKLEDFKAQLEEQVVAKKKQEKIGNIIEKFRMDNDIKVL